jgi:tight adherence protein B
MGFLPLAIVVWMAAMLGWCVSPSFKSSDADKIKQRLMGVGKAARQKAKAAKACEQSMIQTQQSGNKFAQLLVEKYQLGPKMQLFLEQAGLKWTPARLIHLCIMAFAAGLVAAWMLSPLPFALDFVVGLITAPFPFLYVWYQRRGRLRKFEAIFPETLEFISRSMRAGHVFRIARDDRSQSRFPENSVP